MNSLAALLVWFAQATGIPTDELVPAPPPTDTADSDDAVTCPPHKVGKADDLNRIYNGI